MQLNKINWFAFVGGSLILFIILASFYFPWWQLIVGKDIFIINVSPVNTNFGLGAAQFRIPLIWALNIGTILTFLASGITMLIYSLMPTKPYAKDLLSFGYRKPIYAVIFCITGLLITTIALQSVLGIAIPLYGAGTANFSPSSFIPNSPGVNISIAVTSSFQWPFFLAITAAAFCIIARIYHGKLTRQTANAPAVPKVTPADASMPAVPAPPTPQ
jgi:hypothetical protein